MTMQNSLKENTSFDVESVQSLQNIHHNRCKGSRTNPFKAIYHKITHDEIFIAIFKTPKHRLALITTTCLIVGNIGYYFLRLHLPLSIPALEEENILTRVEWGKIISIAYFVNIIGKAFGGAFVDISKQPKWMFVLALCGCAVCACLMTVFHSFASLAVLWCTTRFMTSAGRLASIKIVLAFWPKNIIGTIMGLINVSCSAGDVLARFFIGKTLDAVNWKTTMYFTAIIGTILILPTTLIVANSPKAAFSQEPFDIVGSQMIVPVLQEIEEPLTKHRAPAKSNSEAKGTTFISKIRAWSSEYWTCCLKPLVTQPKFYILLLLSTTLQVLSEIPGQLTHLFLKSELHLSTGEAGSFTSYIRLAGSLSPFIGGYFMDKVSPAKRGLLTAFFVALTSVSFFALTVFTSTLDSAESYSLETKLTIIMIIASVIEFFLQPPNSYLDGVFLLDLNGIDGAATAAGIVGSVGYILPACLMSKMMEMSNHGTQGWVQVWQVAFLVSLAAIGLCLMYWILDERALYLKTKADAQSLAYKYNERAAKSKKSFIMRLITRIFCCRHGDD